MPLIVGSIKEKNPSRFLNAIELAENADIIEVRIDDMANFDSENIKTILKTVNERGKKSILTNRKREDGGGFTGIEDERVGIIEKCITEADYVDLELQMPSLRKMVDISKDADVKVIISYHNFSSTPTENEMLDIIDNEFNEGANIAKLATKANSTKDILSMLAVTKKGSDIGDVCTISLGDLGKISRIASPLFGSVITYGYVTKPTAPGQLHIDELKNILNIFGEMR
jgi:3-dehydroquinate dehydratase-1|tara:strand:- start:155 stop:838 length:684 start_codon:yes stop_codon:yes gene_type:complete